LGGLYELINWHYALSLPLYFAAAVATRALTVKIERITGAAKRTLGQQKKYQG
jgi:hypothetical protein